MGSITACFVATAALVSSKEASGRESHTRAFVRFIRKYTKRLYFLSPFGGCQIYVLISLAMSCLCLWQLWHEHL